MKKKKKKQCNMNDDRSYRQTYLKNCSAHVKKGEEGRFGVIWEYVRARKAQSLDGTLQGT